MDSRGNSPLIRGYTSFIRMITRRDDFRWISWRVRTYPEEKLVYGAATDITEQKTAEQVLLSSEKRPDFTAAGADHTNCTCHNQDQQIVGACKNEPGGCNQHRPDDEHAGARGDRHE